MNSLTDKIEKQPTEGLIIKGGLLAILIISPITIHNYHTSEIINKEMKVIENNIAPNAVRHLTSTPYYYEDEEGFYEMIQIDGTNNQEYYKVYRNTQGDTVLTRVPTQ